MDAARENIFSKLQSPPSPQRCLTKKKRRYFLLPMNGSKLLYNFSNRAVEAHSAALSVFFLSWLDENTSIHLYCKALHTHSCIYLHVSHVVMVPLEPVGDEHFASENAETS